MMDIKKMQAAAIALRDNNCEENYIEHINQSCPANVLELIAENARLQSIIDAANAQEPVGYTGSGSVDAVKVGVEGHLFGISAPSHPIALYAHPIPEQQSPAVAVPDMFTWLPRLLDDYERQAKLNGFTTDTSLGMVRAAFNAGPTPSPRITEQDAREILNAYWASNADDDWVTTAECRALLDKLNGVKNETN